MKNILLKKTCLQVLPLSILINNPKENDQVTDKTNGLKL